MATLWPATPGDFMADGTLEASRWRLGVEFGVFGVWAPRVSRRPTARGSGAAASTPTTSPPCWVRCARISTAAGVRHGLVVEDPGRAAALPRPPFHAVLRGPPPQRQAHDPPRLVDLVDDLLDLALHEGSASLKRPMAV